MKGSKYEFSVTYKVSDNSVGAVMGAEDTRAEAERSISWYCGFYKGRGHEVINVHLSRRVGRLDTEELELPRQIGFWTR